MIPYKQEAAPVIFTDNTTTASLKRLHTKNLAKLPNFSENTTQFEIKKNIYISSEGRRETEGVFHLLPGHTFTQQVHTHNKRKMNRT